MKPLTLTEINSFLLRHGWKVGAVMYFGGAAWCEWLKEGGRKVTWTKLDGVDKPFIRVATLN